MDLNGIIGKGSSSKLSEAIRRDIADILRKKGINVKKVNVDLKADLLNLSVSISDRR